MIYLSLDDVLFSLSDSDLRAISDKVFSDSVGIIDNLQFELSKEDFGKLVTLLYIFRFYLQNII